MVRFIPLYNFIKVGDCVSVNFNNSMFTLCSCAVVEHVPIDTGDSWIFTDNNTNEIHYVSEGCTISKINTDNTLNNRD